MTNVAIDAVIVTSSSEGTWIDPTQLTATWMPCAEQECGGRATTLTGRWCPRHWCVASDCDERAMYPHPHSNGRCKQHQRWSGSIGT